MTSLYAFFERLTGRAEPAERFAFGEWLLTLIWLTALILLILIFWPQGGSFIYEGF